MILIFSCKRDQANGFNGAIRDTWLKEWPGAAPYRFIIGRADTLLPDEISVDARDAYENLVDKQVAAYKWAVEQKVESVFVCYTDTHVHIPRLLASGSTEHLYTGRQDCEGRPFAGGGMGYWLNREALEICSRPALPVQSYPEMYACYPDEFDGYHLHRHAISVYNDSRYGGPPKDGTTITQHLSKETGCYYSAWMHEAHQRSISS